VAKAIIIIPCYNESKRLDLRQFQLLDEYSNHHLLFVNDGSRDSTSELLAPWCQINPSHRRLLNLPSNVGKAEAIRRGMSLCSDENPDIIGYADADLATPVSEINRLVKALESAPPDISAVLGSRIRRLGADISRNPFRHYAGRALASIASILLKMSIYDTQCGAKFFRNDLALRNSIQEPFLARWIFDVELLGRLSREYEKTGRRRESAFLEIPLRQWSEVGGSNISTGSFVRAAFDLIRICFKFEK